MVGGFLQIRNPVAVLVFALERDSYIINKKEDKIFDSRGRLFFFLTRDGKHPDLK